jgi:hypothetical protein
MALFGTHSFLSPRNFPKQLGVDIAALDFDSVDTTHFTGAVKRMWR